MIDSEKYESRVCFAKYQNQRTPCNFLEGFIHFIRDCIALNISADCHFQLKNMFKAKRKTENQLIRFVWSRNLQYDFYLLLETEAKNPFSFKNQKPVWEEISKILKESDLKMKVTDRSCRDRVNDLLKKHRKEEGVIIRS